jgi:hypothetical protein
MTLTENWNDGRMEWWIAEILEQQKLEEWKSLMRTGREEGRRGFSGECRRRGAEVLSGGRLWRLKLGVAWSRDEGFDQVPFSSS